MTLIVCPLRDVALEMTRSKPARLISLLGPEQEAPRTPPGVSRLTLRFHDIPEPRLGLIAPDRIMIADLLAFGAAWSEPAPLLVHCWMGVSRSPAAALVLACAADPSRDEGDIALALRRVSPCATPNPLVVALADDLLGREGRLVAAAASIGRGAETSRGETFRLAARPGSRRGMD
ncbi:MAG TPA: hypothetical protein VHY32_09880 [Caulobacteraceae bacterium]|jgi:predicted protein tyrosine phosphatase|nr:hypothetical protein [Caulobacteraceae bacterium]